MYQPLGWYTGKELAENNLDMIWGYLLMNWITKAHYYTTPLSTLSYSPTTLYLLYSSLEGDRPTPECLQDTTPVKGDLVMTNEFLEWSFRDWIHFYLKWSDVLPQIF